MAANAQERLDLAVVDYGMGNLRSVLRAFEACGGAPRLVRTPNEVCGARALVFPGQGAMPEAMRRLRATGFDSFLRDWISADRPFFGICLGMQALFEHSQEGDSAGLGVFRGEVKKFDLGREFKIPHMGWNGVAFRKEGRDPLLEGIAPEGDYFYFVHSYYVDTPDADLVWGRSHYGHPFVCAVRRGRCVATQFHPEKSQSKGLRLYQNFLQFAANLS